MTTVRHRRIKRIMPLLIVVFCASVLAYAEYGGGSGMADEPYQIITAADLVVEPAGYQIAHAVGGFFPTAVGSHQSGSGKSSRVNAPVHGVLL